MSVEVVLPYRETCQHRERALTWVQAQYHDQHPGWKVTVAVPPAGPWCKALAVQPAAQASTADILIVADADVWTDHLATTVATVATGAPWAIPHQIVERLTDYATAELLAGTPPAQLDTAERPYRGVMGGGIVVLPRHTLLEIPLDARFTGWGQEDTSWALALHVLAGPAWRGTGRLLHLWHEPQDRMNRKTGSTEGQTLFRRYASARRHPDAMHALVQEAQACLSSLC